MLLSNTGKKFRFIDTLRLKVYIVFKIKYINENVAKRHSISKQKLRVRKGNTTFKYIFGLLTVLNAIVADWSILVFLSYRVATKQAMKLNILTKEK